MTSQFSKILLERYQGGDSRAAGELYDRYAKRLLGLARQRLTRLLAAKVDPDDISQAAFQAFFELADQDQVRWDREGDLWRLLSGIAVNQVLRQAEHFSAEKRRADREVGGVGINEVAWSDQQVDVAAVQEINDLVANILDNEKPLARRVLTLRLAGATQVEIATRLQRSERTVRRVLQTIKSKFATFYDLDLDTPNSTELSTATFSADYGGYDLMQMIGAGAFGKVYLGRENQSGALVAIKVLRKSWLDRPDVERQFLTEAKQLAQLQHPNIVSFLSAGPIPNGSWFIVMEHVTGTPLRSAESSLLTTDRVLQWLTGIGSAISYLHDNQLIHGDLNPANVLVNQNKATLIDFGLSVLQAEESATKLMGGTEGFLAPEQTTSKPADIFSFGKIVQFVDRIAGRQLEANVRNQLAEIARQAIALDPRERIVAGELQQRLAVICDYTKQEQHNELNDGS